ncbi:MAG: hypothetical protein V1815_02830 [Candidatus Woesearchaeota archaeon]
MKKGDILLQKRINYNYDDMDFYEQDYIEEALENDEISSEEQAFMVGYLEE